jgi:hypothetical protein
MVARVDPDFPHTRRREQFGHYGRGHFRSNAGAQVGRPR